MDPIEDLVRDYAARFAGMARELEERLVEAAVMRRAAQGSASEVDLVRVASSVLARRRSRKMFFPADLFHEPAWDMLLALYIARAEGRTLFVKALVGSSDAPATTSQRWIEHLDRLGLVERIGDSDDRRRVEVALSDAGHAAMTKYLQSVLAP